MILICATFAFTTNGVPILARRFCLFFVGLLVQSEVKMELSKVIHHKGNELLARANGKDINLLEFSHMRRVVLPTLAQWHGERSLYFIGNEAEAMFKELIADSEVMK